MEIPRYKLSVSERNTLQKQVYIWQLLHNKKDFFFIWFHGGVYSVALDRELYEPTGLLCNIDKEELLQMEAHRPQQLSSEQWWLLLSSLLYLINNRKYRTIQDINKFCIEYLADDFKPLVQYVNEAMLVLTDYRLLREGD